MVQLRDKKLMSSMPIHGSSFVGHVVQLLHRIVQMVKSQSSVGLPGT